jgi:hypothetical protein
VNNVQSRERYAPPERRMQTGQQTPVDELANRAR